MISTNKANEINRKNGRWKERRKIYEAKMSYYLKQTQEMFRALGI